MYNAVYSTLFRQVLFVLLDKKVKTPMMKCVDETSGGTLKIVSELREKSATETEVGIGYARKWMQDLHCLHPKLKFVYQIICYFIKEKIYFPWLIQCLHIKFSKLPNSWLCVLCTRIYVLDKVFRVVSPKVSH